jgi:hypothetical protein
MFCIDSFILKANVVVVVHVAGVEKNRNEQSIWV